MRMSYHHPEAETTQIQRFQRTPENLANQGRRRSICSPTASLNRAAKHRAV